MPPAEAAPSLASRTTANAAINFIGVFWTAVLGVIQVPIVVHALGTDVYGVYVLITIIASYIGLVELNLSAALVKYVAEYAGRSEHEYIQEVIGTTLALYLGLGTCAGIIFLIGGRALLPYLNIPPDALRPAWNALVVTAVALPLTLMSGTIGMVPAAVGRFDISVLVSTTIGTLSTAATIAVALLGGKLVALAGVNAATAIVALTASVVVGKRLFPEVSFWPSWTATRAATLPRTRTEPARASGRVVSSGRVGPPALRSSSSELTTFFRPRALRRMVSSLKPTFPPSAQP